MIKYMLNKIKQMNIKQLQFSGLEFLFWATCSAYYSFNIVYLNEKGFSTTAIGTIIAISSLIVIFAQPFWGMISDRLNSAKKVFVFCMAIAALLLLVVPFIKWIIIIGVLLALITFFESSLVPLLDSWVIIGIRNERDVAYGSIRLWGSIGFAAMAFIMGKIIDITSTSIIYPVYGVMAVFTILLCSKIKVDKPVHAISLRKLHMSHLLHNYSYVTYLIFATFLFIPHRASFIFLPMRITSLGGSKEQLGLALSIMAIAEVPIFLMSKRIFKYIKPLQLILISSVFFILRQVFFALATEPIHLILNQAIQGLGYGMFLMGSVHYIDSLAPESLKSTAQSLATAIFFGVSGIIGSFGGGWFIDNIGMMPMYHLGIAISAGISILFLLSILYGNKLKHKQSLLKTVVEAQP